MHFLLAESTAWWSQSSGAWVGAIGGSACGVIFGGLGALEGWLAPRGIGRRWILGAHIAAIVISVAAAIAGIVALSTGQPYGVWYPLALVGGIGVFVMSPLYFVIRMRYRQAENRKLDASEFRG